VALPAQLASLALLVPGPIDQLTGGYLYARHLVDGLRGRGVDVAVQELAGRFPDADDTAREAAGLALAALPDGAVVVIDGLALAGFRDVVPRAAQRLRLLALVHHPLPEETGLGDAEARGYAALEAALLPRLAGVICPSETTAAAVAACGVSPARIAVVPPGTQKPAASRPQREPDAPLRLLCVATVTPRKGHAVLIEALARLGARHWRLDVIGSLTRDPATAAAVRDALARHDLTARVALLGEWPRARLSEAYAAADLFVLASYHEGYGMAFAEALAHGLPIVATTGGAIPEVVPPSAGILVSPGDVAALADALARLIDDAALRARLAAGAVAEGNNLPSWDDTVERWLAAAGRFVA
jgi:glycosyltransferase involved in cell wall biosynthesis